MSKEIFSEFNQYDEFEEFDEFDDYELSDFEDYINNNMKSNKIIIRDEEIIKDIDFDKVSDMFDIYDDTNILNLDMIYSLPSPPPPQDVEFSDSIELKYVYPELYINSYQESVILYRQLKSKNSIKLPQFVSSLKDISIKYLPTGAGILTGIMLFPRIDFLKQNIPGLANTNSLMISMKISIFIKDIVEFTKNIINKKNKIREIKKLGRSLVDNLAIPYISIISMSIAGVYLPIGYGLVSLGISITTTGLSDILLKGIFHLNKDKYELIEEQIKEKEEKEKEKMEQLIKLIKEGKKFEEAEEIFENQSKKILTKKTAAKIIFSLTTLSLTSIYMEQIITLLTGYSKVGEIITYLSEDAVKNTTNMILLQIFTKYMKLKPILDKIVDKSVNKNKKIIPFLTKYQDRNRIIKWLSGITYNQILKIILNHYVNTGIINITSNPETSLIELLSKIKTIPYTLLNIPDNILTTLQPDNISKLYNILRDNFKTSLELIKDKSYKFGDLLNIKWDKIIKLLKIPYSIEYINKNNNKINENEFVEKVTENNFVIEDENNFVIEDEDFEVDFKPTIDDSEIENLQNRLDNSINKLEKENEKATNLINDLDNNIKNVEGQIYRLKSLLDKNTYDSIKELERGKLTLIGMRTFINNNRNEINNQLISQKDARNLLKSNIIYDKKTIKNIENILNKVSETDNKLDNISNNMNQIKNQIKDQVENIYNDNFKIIKQRSGLLSNEKMENILNNKEVLKNLELTSEEISRLKSIKGIKFDNLSKNQFDSINKFWNKLNQKTKFKNSNTGEEVDVETCLLNPNNESCYYNSLGRIVSGFIAEQTVASMLPGGGFTWGTIKSVGTKIFTYTAGDVMNDAIKTIMVETLVKAGVKPEDAGEIITNIQRSGKYNTADVMIDVISNKDGLETMRNYFNGDTNIFNVGIKNIPKRIILGDDILKLVFNK